MRIKHRDSTQSRLNENERPTTEEENKARLQNIINASQISTGAQNIYHSSEKRIKNTVDRSMKPTEASAIDRPPAKIPKERRQSRRNQCAVTMETERVEGMVSTQYAETAADPVYGNMEVSRWMRPQELKEHYEKMIQQKEPFAEEFKVYIYI